MVLFTLFITFSIGSVLCDTNSTTTINQSIVFMDKLKTVLRTNNDDYIDLNTTNTTAASTTTTNTTTTTSVAATTTNKQGLTTNANRRALSPNKNNKISPILRDFTKHVKKENKNTLKPNSLLNEKKQVKDKYPKYVNKMSKMKTFLHKNKDLFKKFMNNRTSKTYPMLRIKSSTTTKTISTTKSIDIKDTKAGSEDITAGTKDTGKGRSSKVGRALFTSTSTETESGDTLEYMEREANRDMVANSQQLDMAAAKGGYIHAQRLKGRLCQRNVLIPEGPKYDSKGVSYLPAYTPVRGHDFVQTKAPKAFLPRCCNCCKKSVLGCE